MDSYQPIYDAIRSKVSHVDFGGAVENAIREANLSHYVEMTAAAFQEAAYEQMRPCILLKPALKIDGNQWCALYGDNLQDGIAGFGNSPSDAMHAFDKNYHTNLAA